MPTHASRLTRTGSSRSLSSSPASPLGGTGATDSVVTVHVTPRVEVLEDFSLISESASILSSSSEPSRVTDPYRCGAVRSPPPLVRDLGAIVTSQEYYDVCASLHTRKSCGSELFRNETSDGFVGLHAARGRQAREAASTRHTSVSSAPQAQRTCKPAGPTTHLPTSSRVIVWISPGGAGLLGSVSVRKAKMRSRGPALAPPRCQRRDEYTVTEPAPTSTGTTRRASSQAARMMAGWAAEASGRCDPGRISREPQSVAIIGNQM